MRQEQIDYIEIVNLKFDQQTDSDQKYYNQYGYDYVIITLKLTKHIYIDWAKETRLAKMIRSNKESDILATMPIMNLQHLKEMVKFFIEES